MKYSIDKCDDRAREAKEQEQRVRTFKEQTGLNTDDVEVIEDTTEAVIKGEKSNSNYANTIKKYLNTMGTKTWHKQVVIQNCTKPKEDKEAKETKEEKVIKLELGDSKEEDDGWDWTDSDQDWERTIEKRMKNG